MAYPMSLQHKDYPEEAYNEFMKQIELIKNSNDSNNVKWDNKYNLTKTFIEKHNRLPYWWYVNIGCNANREISIKSVATRKHRIDRLSQIFECNFIKDDGVLCKKPTACRYDYIKDPFKCSNHLKRCPNCIEWIDSHGCNRKYDNYCARCFKRLFPDDERRKIIHSHAKEITVRNVINTHFEGFIHDKPLYTGNCDCTHRRRIDHRKLIKNTLLCIETDEFAHSRYDAKDEEIRYDDLYMVFSGKWIFIRFNPDGRGVDMTNKLNVLIEEINRQIQRIEDEKNSELVEIIKLFY